MVLATLTRRVEALEAHAAWITQEHIEVKNRLDHVTGAIGVLSEDQRAFRHEVMERFDGIDRRLDGMDQRFDGIDQRLDRMENLVGAIATHLGVPGQAVD